MNCTYCGSEDSNNIVTGKVTQVLANSISIKVTKKPRLDKEGKVKSLKDNEFIFCLRRGDKEFVFCKVMCLAKYMGFDDAGGL